MTSETEQGELQRSTIVELPLRGEWVVERTPADRIPSHGTDALGQRYAYDFVRRDVWPRSARDRARSLGRHVIGRRVADLPGWGETVHAAAGGDVVVASDGAPERLWWHALRESAMALGTTMRFARDPTSVDVRSLAGNHVIVACGAVYAVYAHLAPDSVAVVAGQRVSTGDVLGRVGHTGNSTAPHLHFHLMDSADPLEASGVVAAFARYLTFREGRWEQVCDAIPSRRERVRSTP